ncbi:Calcipressin, partial [Vararia minispora EC-137]
SPTPPNRTNTLVLAQLPPPFFEPLVLTALRQHFEEAGQIHSWAPLRAFGRVILVYYDEEAAEAAKLGLDGIVIDATASTPQFTLRVFRGDPTPITAVPDMYLHPPAIEKNFLISPPGSPPVGWEPIKEDPPNAAPLAEDLIAALRRLQLAAPGGGPHVEILFEPEDGQGISVYVEDCDCGIMGDEEQDWAYGSDNPSRMQWRPVPTAMPPQQMAVN